MGKSYTAQQVSEMIERYFQMKQALGIHVETPYSESRGFVQDYDAVGMPRGQGGISDPTFKQAFAMNTVISERMAQQYMEYIEFIDEHTPLITKIREQAVLHWRLSGMQTKHIAELEGITDRHVRRILNDIAEKMSKMSDMSVLSDVS